uniref:Uncharacterized protein n=1 Tax=Periophthalmus magnuspinnatus TaxID=409849 RepID=A0A3B4BFQ2_9GOBI
MLTECKYFKLNAYMCIFSAYFTRRVGYSRLAHKIKPPATTGHPEFERAFRAHQNCVEFYPLFLVSMWSCGVFFSEPIAAAGGLVFIVGRLLYFNGYIRETHKRLPGFWVSVAVFFSLSFLGMIGIVQEILHKYFYIYS